jgi:hypothetical protein
MEENGKISPEPPDPQKSRGFRNIWDMIRLLAGLAVAWFILDWLMDRLMGSN